MLTSEMMWTISRIGSNSQELLLQVQASTETVQSNPSCLAHSLFNELCREPQYLFLLFKLHPICQATLVTCEITQQSVRLAFSARHVPLVSL